MESSIRQRLVALSLCLSMLAGVVIPPASAYATANAVPPAADTTSNAANNAPGPLPDATASSSIAPAAGTQTPSFLQSTTSIFNQQPARTDLDQKSREAANPFAYKPSMQDHGQVRSGATTTHKRKALLTEGRTAFNKVYLNEDGTKTLEKSMQPSSYRDGTGAWKDVNVALQDNPSHDHLQTTANSWGDSFGKNDITQGIALTKDGQSLTFKPIGGQTSKPVVTGTAPNQLITYKNVWPGVDVQYQAESGQLKESIIITSSVGIRSGYQFDVQGATLSPDPNQPGWLTADGTFANFTVAPPTIASKKLGVLGGDPYVNQAVQGATLTISLDQAWAQKQPADAYPLTIDPTTVDKAIAGNYANYSNTGITCGVGQGCGNATGNLYLGANQYWRFVMRSSYDELIGKTLINAWLNLDMPSPEDPQGYSTPANRYIVANHAVCWGYNCWDGGITDSVALTGMGVGMDVTHIYQELINRGDYGGWLIVRGEENNAYYSYKEFDPAQTFVGFTYDSPTPMTTPAAAAPVDGATVVTTQPSLLVNTVTDPDTGDVANYDFRISTGPGGESGVVADSGWQSNVQWSVPDGVLQDGVTYYWHAYTMGSGGAAAATAPNWTRSFKVDMRTGKDTTQSFDDAGALSNNLATGNVTTGAKTHSIAALGGSLGLSLDYNSPQRSRSGLVGEYWNVSSGWDGSIPTGAPRWTRVDSRLDFPWGAGSPAQGIINADWFVARWTGYFVTPTTGTYYFGANDDDTMRVYVNNTLLYNAPCLAGTCYGSSVNLTAGQVVPLRVEYNEQAGDAFAKLFVKGAVAEQIVPEQWMQTGVRPVGSQQGLTGRYFYDPGTHVFPADDNQAFVTRNDNYMSFDWGAGSPVPGGPTDNFMTRWAGYITAPQAGNYYIYGSGDDGCRVTINGTVVQDHWTSAGAISAVTLAAGQTVSIVVEYYEATGNANFNLRVSGAVPDQTVPTTWLMPQTSGLPAGWQMGQDMDGNLSYDRAIIGDNSVVLADSTGDRHTYTWTGSGYKPPVNEDGQLTRNADGTLTLQDSDGRTYVFNANGTLQSSSTPMDDRKPATLNYTYATPSGGAPRLSRIADSVDPSRYGDVLYSGDANCPTPPSGYAAAPSNMICAFKTSDGQLTKFLYTTGGLLGRVELPGTEQTDYGYDSLGRIVQMRDSLANDAIAAGVRANDATATTELAYDILGRVSTVTLPAATTGATRLQRSYEYLPNDTRVHVATATEPSGFSRKITYDGTYRTTTDTDIANLTSSTEWDTIKDLVLSKTDATGLKSTTIYDYDDRPIQAYGPAPAAWYAGDRTPLSTYVSQVPHTQSNYDEGIAGLAAAYYNYGATNKTMVGAPKLHGTGIGAADGSVYKTWNSTLPVTPDSGYSMGVRMTGEIKLNTAGTYYFRPYSDDGLRMYIDDQLIVNDWNDGPQRWHPIVQYSNATAGSYHRISIDYYDRGNGDARLELYTTSGMGGGGEALVPGNTLGPRYGLATSTTVYDATLGNTTSTTGYGSNPELGLAQATTTDSTGLNLTTTGTYETQGAAGSYLRQTAKYLPGANTATASTGTQYSYYGATETRDNPCTTGTVEAYKQAGMLKFKTEPDPDGAGAQTSRVTETIYDDAGRVVATRYNTDSWTCTTYDARGRAITIAIPAFGSAVARTVTYNYSVGATPFVTSVSDNSGTITTTNDLLGRTTSYTDANGQTTTTSYDALGRMSGHSGPLGVESFVYDSYNRPTDQKLDGTIYATTYYDTYGRTDHVAYPTAGSLALAFTRDTLGRTTGYNYTLGNGTAGPSDSVTLSQSSQIVSGTELGLSKSYTYDTANRLTAATIGSNNYAYAFGTPTSCTGTYNASAGKDGNRTSQTVNGTTTTFCYDYADRLLNSSNNIVTSPVYDSHGNTTSLGSGTPTTFGYDSSDRNVSITQGAKSTTYIRDAQGRLTKRTLVNGTTTINKYAYTTSADSPDLLLDNSNAVVEKYLQLPGGVVLTIRSSTKVFSLPNVHGDIFATTSATGGSLATFAYDPFGNPVSASPNNTATGSTYGYVGQNEKDTETAFTLAPTQMGARVYIPLIGRFLQVDPVEGGTPSNYVYPTDPVNDFDLSGTIAWKKNAKTTWNVACGSGWWMLSCVPGIGEVGQAARAAKAIHTVEAARAVKAAQLAKNAVKGKAAEGEVYRQLVKQYGKNNVRQQVYNQTAQGARRSDFLVNNGGKQFFVEVKSGNAVYSRLQQQKDAYLEAQLGIPTILRRVP